MAANGIQTLFNIIFLCFYSEQSMDLDVAVNPDHVEDRKISSLPGDASENYGVSVGTELIWKKNEK